MLCSVSYFYYSYDIYVPSYDNMNDYPGVAPLFVVPHHTSPFTFFHVRPAFSSILLTLLSTEMRTCIYTACQYNQPKPKRGVSCTISGSLMGNNAIISTWISLKSYKQPNPTKTSKKEPPRLPIDQYTGPNRQSTHPSAQIPS